MTHVVAEPCVLCKHTDCVEVCPVDAFREGENCLVIDPTECIDCTLCVAVCPERAIFIESELPPRWSEWLELNERLARDWPMLRRKLSSLPGYQEARSIADRRSRLSESPGSGSS
jgi:ferredoxin